MYDQYRYIRSVVLFTLVLSVALFSSSCRGVEGEPSDGSRSEVTTSSAVEDPPNIVFIISDDHRWDDFSFMGHSTIETPNIDQLATQSAVFPNGYVPSSLCRPSLATLITGQYPHQHGITGNDPPEGVHRQEMVRFIARTYSLPRLLRHVGYVSLQTGKWWEGHYGTGGFTHGMTINDDEGRHGDRGLQIGRDSMQPIEKFIEAHKEEPFFLWYAPFLPHTPHNPPERLLEKYQSDDRPEELARYYAMVEWFDETVGQLLSYLEEEGLQENTIVLFAVDNGWIQNIDREEGEFLFAAKSKRSPYDGGVRTPIMIRWPNHVEPGKRPELASTIDFVPTVLEAVGLSVPEELPGRNLVELSEGQEEREAIYGEVFAHDAVDLSEPATSLKYRWVREGEWKLIVPASEGEGTMELYNIEEDPDEEMNRAEEHPDIVESLLDRLDAWWQPNKDAFGLEDPFGSGNP